jgi:hypothetical protein
MLSATHLTKYSMRRRHSPNLSTDAKVGPLTPVRSDRSHDEQAETESVNRTAGSRRKRILVLAGIGSIVIVGGAVASVWLVARDSRQARHRLHLARANALLAAQHLDVVFNQFASQLADPNRLASGDRIALETWLQFDQKFVDQNAHNLEIRFERATVHRRLGHGLTLLGRRPQARYHLERASALFGDLSHEYRTVPSYLGGLADTCVRLGDLRLLDGEFQAAELAYQRAATLMQNECLPHDAMYHLQTAEIDEKLAHMADRRGATDQAVLLRERVVATLRRLSEEVPESPMYRDKLRTAQDKLDALRTKTG